MKKVFLFQKEAFKSLQNAKSRLFLVLFFAMGLGSYAQITVTGADATTNGASPYTTLKAAFDNINLVAQTGNSIVIAITGNTTETASAVLNVGAWTSITINPSGGAARTISGTISGPLLDLNGADNVTIDGLNTAGNTLVLQNSNALTTSGISTIRFINGAMTNIVTNCTVLGASSADVSVASGNILFSTDASTINGNDNNTISNCNIGPAVAVMSKAIYGSGSTTTVAIGNSGNIINNNNIYDYFGAAVTSAGVYTASGCNTWSITNNRFYQTGTRTWTTGAQHSPIWILSSTATSGAQGFTITGNSIGYASNTQTGTYTLTGSTGKFTAILYNGISTGTMTNINSNTIAAVNISGVTSSGTGSGSPFMGMYIATGLVTTNDNTIGSQVATNSIVFSTTTTTTTNIYGIYSFSSDNWVSNNNTIGGYNITNLGASGTFVLWGLRANTGTSLTWIATSNTIGGSVVDSMQLTSNGAASQIIGIQTINAIGTLTANTVRNLTNNSGTGTAGAASVIGMSSTSSANQTFSRNIIFNLKNTNTSLATTVTGIQFTGGTANVIERNTIYGLTSDTNSTTAEINGIRVAGGTTIYRNNMITLGAGVINAIGTAASNSNTSGINGFNGTLGTDSFFNNSVYIEGSPIAGVGGSYAFNGTQTANTRSFRNNIFFNARSNSGATGKHYAVKINGTTTNPTGLTINNNIYFANGTGGVLGFFNSSDVATLAAWQTAVGQDAASINSNPLFVSASNLSLQAGSPAIDVAVNLSVSNDITGETRPGANLLYDIGADERDGIPLPANDMQATTFISPINAGSVSQSVAFAPQASFTNGGTANQTSITVRYRILNPSAVEVYNQTFVIPALASFASTTVTFPNATLSAVGIHTIFAKAELVGDTVGGNDEASGTITVVPLPMTTVASGNWNAGSTWNTGVAPGCFDVVTVSSTHVVTVNSAANVSRNVTIASGGSLTVASGDLTVGCTNKNNSLTNNGTLTISGGTLNLNGNYDGLSTSTFNQSGGEMIVDGNNGGVPLGSVASGTKLFSSLSNLINLSGGILTFVDPHVQTAGTMTETFFLNNATTSTNTLVTSPTHITRLGNGVSNDNCANVAGFRINTWEGSTFINFGKVVVDSGNTGTNRNVSSTYNFSTNSDFEIKSNIVSIASLVIGGDLKIDSGARLNSTTSLNAAIVTSNLSSSLVFGSAIGSFDIVNNGFLSGTAAGVVNDNLTVLSLFNTTGLTFNAITLSMSGTFQVSGTTVATIPSGKNLTLGGIVTVAASSTLTFENNSNLIQTAVGANSGNITVKRNTAMQRLAYTYWGSPVAAQNLLAFSPLTLPNRFATYSEPTGAFVTVAVPSTTNFAVGTGYSVRAPNTFADAPAAATAFVGTFTGVPNNGTVTVTGTKDTNGDNLIGNPYPCTINAIGAGGFITVNPSTLYYWTKSVLGAPSGNNYASQTNLTGTAASAGSPVPNGIIQVGQGFFCSVAPSAGTSSLVFNNAMKVGNNANQFFRNATTIEKHLIKLNLTTPTANFNQIAVGYMTGATDGFDAGIDGLVFGGGNPTMISSLINGVDYVIQGKALAFTPADVVPLGFRAETAGSYTISTADTEGVFAGAQDFYIKDNLTGTTHNIKQTPYNFVSNAGTFNARFQLVYQTVLGVSNPSIENGLVAFVKNDMINIKSTIDMTDIKVYDLSGRLVYEKSKINTKAIELNDLKTEHQMLLIQITADGKTVTKKIVY